MARYDIIIAGGGTAGSVLASRLTCGAPDLKVLLLEAGPDNNNDALVRTPLYSARMLGDPKYDWCYQSVPQAELDGRTLPQPRGRMLGGSSAINSHSLVYPNQEMHDAWASLVGDSQWNWQNMKHYYMKFQEIVDGSAQVTGHGPIKASSPVAMNLLQRTWVEAFEELELLATEPTTGHAIGGTIATNAIDPRSGERSHAAKEYLAPVMNAENLTVVTAATVVKIEFHTGSGHHPQASGVQYLRNGQSYFALASKEVILCAGAFGTPKILELSGVGNEDILKSFDIQQRVDLPGVGGELQP
jgi:choline dehydrogenase-like flavoprotein